jgi:hypothetical protein
MVWRVGDQGAHQLKKLAPRLPRTLHELKTDPKTGELTGLVQYVQVGTTRAYPEIKRDYLALFTHEREGNNWQGTSILRSAYKHYVNKELCYRIDGVRLDRFGVGIPKAKLLEPGIRADELDKIEKVLKSLRSHERAYLIEPPNVQVAAMAAGRICRPSPMRWKPRQAQRRPRAQRGGPETAGPFTTAPDRSAQTGDHASVTRGDAAVPGRKGPDPARRPRARRFISYTRSRAR